MKRILVKTVAHLTALSRKAMHDIISIQQQRFFVLILMRK